MSNTTTQTEVNAVKVVRTWEERVQELEDLGADRSDAQAIVDAEDQTKINSKPPCDCGSNNASWHGRTRREYCCDKCYSISPTRESVWEWVEK
jgi:hypothetical protein